MLCKHEANPQGNDNAEARYQQSHFTTLLKSHTLTDTPPKIRSTSTEHPSPGELICETAFVCQKNVNETKIIFRNASIFNLFALESKKE